MENIDKSLEISRSELLDMGLRGNSLLHFRASAKNLEVVDEISPEIFRIMVSEQKAMSFIPLPDKLVDKNNNVDNTQPLPQILEEMFGEDRHTDTKLQTKLAADPLDKRLLKISTEAEAFTQEQGVDLLYLALGFLTWFEDKNSEKPRKAPLVLVPVSLSRGNARERFKIEYTQADLGPNLTLAAKLKMEFQIMLPDFGDELDIGDYFRKIENLISKQPRWQLNNNEISLGFFSFGKFQMYQDLDPDNWPEGKKPNQNSVIKGLLGGGLAKPNSGNVGDGENSGAFPEPILTDLNFVKDADSSQTEAVMAVKGGSNLVIQGPPGTGKSQTITNIISESLADGKTVLFVAEKMAALEVVKRRLDECHLGDAVLELHSHKSNKKTILENLKRTLDLGNPSVPDRTAEKRRHAALQKELDDYCEQVNQTILDSQISYIDALGYYLQLKDETTESILPELDFGNMRNWSKEDFVESCSLVNEVVQHLNAMGTPTKNPYSLSTLEYFSPVEQNQVITRLEKSRSLLNGCIKTSCALSKEMGLKAPFNIGDIEAICRAGKRALNAPHLKGLALTTDDWQERRDQIKALTDAGTEMSSLKIKHKDKLIDQAWTSDLLSTRQAWATTGMHWWRFLSSEFRTAKRFLQGLLKEGFPAKTEDSVALIDDILKYQTLNEEFEAYERLGESLFGAQWQGKRSDWPVLQALSNWVIELYDEVGKGRIPAGLLRFLEGDKELAGWEETLDKLNKATGVLKSRIEDVKQRIASELPGAMAKDFEDIPLEVLKDDLEIWHEQIDSLYQMTKYNNLRKKLNARELSEIDALAYGWELEPSLLLTTLKKAWYEGLVNEAYRENNSLKNFDRISHENTILEFQRLDAELFHHAQEDLVLKHHQNLPSAGAAGEMAILRREMNKKRRHLPIRRLVEQAGRAIQQIKPIFMMSPMSVSTYLEQGALEFDLVVFDEASQVKVVDALGPILRGKQVVVVGDTRQMPPTDFFGKAIELDDDEAEESYTADIESILSMFLAQGAPESMLRWHYRSRHDSLICVSNQEFYDGRLMVFPSPGVNPLAKGLQFRHIPETIYERGGSRTNPLEARAVAEAVMIHAKKSPSITLGVVAFSTAQRDCILLELERLRREDPSTEGFFTADTLEGFFVKNLENVQGDERDVIFISIGYGRTSTGRVTGSFGPVNRDGGERRLNVLITRSRLAMEVFCNFTADDIETTHASAFGVRALKSFLRFAETGEIENRLETGKDTDSPFEDEVISAIRQLGYTVEPQVGSAGFYIDIAVRDPSKPGRYILAVECDGASYHSSATARDRDRLRQSVLEGLGWRFHRIWSTDWFRNPHKETEKVKESIEQAIQFYNQLEANDTNDFLSESSAANPGREILREDSTEDVGVKADAYLLASGNLGISHNAEIHELGLDTLAQSLIRIVDIEGPIHLKEAARRLAESAGFSRVGARMLNHISLAAAQANRNSQIHLEDSFIFRDSSKPRKVRDRSALPATQKNIEFVSNEEIGDALVAAIKSAFSLHEDEAISEALSMMGFQRATAKAKQQVQAVLSVLQRENSVQIENNKLIVA